MKDIIKENKNIHNIIAKKYNKRHYEIYNKIEQERISNLIKYIKFLIGKEEIVALDYGSGTGNLTNHYLSNNFETYSLDISQKSLDVLKKMFIGNKKLNIKKFDGYDIPYESEKFDLVGAYSVMHHIPDYLKALEDMARVVKTGAYILIDHESNSNYWNPDKYLADYNKISNNFFKKLFNIIRSGEIYEFGFWKGVFIRKFRNSRFRNEGDIHVFKDDHIEWDKIKLKLEKLGFEIIENKDYLLYNINVGKEYYNKYKGKTSNMSYLIAKKIS